MVQLPEVMRIDPALKVMGIPTVVCICLVFGIYIYGMEKIDAGITSFFATHQGLTGWVLVILSLVGLRVWYKRNVW